MSHFRNAQQTRQGRRARRARAAARGLRGRRGLGEEIPMIQTSVPGESPMPVSGDIQVANDLYGYASPVPSGTDGSGDVEGAAHTALRAPAGKTIEISALVSALDNLHVRLVAVASRGDGPVWDSEKSTPWRNGRDMEMSLRYEVPEWAEYIGFGIDQPNPDYPDQSYELPDSARSGRLVYEDFQIRQLPPSAEAGTQSGMGSITTLAAIGVGGIAVQQLVSRYL